MPLQFGVLTGKFNSSSSFGSDDHRSTRLSEEVLVRLLSELESVWPIAARYETSKTAFSLSFAAGIQGVSTVIPGIRTPEQVEANTTDLVEITEDDLLEMRGMYEGRFDSVVDFLHDSEK